MGATRHYRLGRIRIGNAAKVGGTLGCVVGLLGGLVHFAYLMSMTVPEAETVGPLMALPVFYVGVAGLDGMILAALCAWVFNVSTRFSGGLVLQLEELSDPVAAS